MSDSSSSTPASASIAPNPATWNIIVGALFGLLTLVGLFAFAFLSAIYPKICSKFQFQLLAGGFALGLRWQADSLVVAPGHKEKLAVPGSTSCLASQAARPYSS